MLRHLVRFAPLQRLSNVEKVGKYTFRLFLDCGHDHMAQPSNLGGEYPWPTRVHCLDCVDKEVRMSDEPVFTYGGVPVNTLFPKLEGE